MNITSERDEWMASLDQVRLDIRADNRRCAREHRTHWRVTVYRANHSAFSGYRRTRSDYSELQCRWCGRRWRTKAAYVESTPHDLFLEWNEIQEYRQARPSCSTS